MANERLARKFLRRNPDTLTDAELLELLLQFSHSEPEKMAHRLLVHYPNIANLLEADVMSLSSIEELDEDSVLLLRLVPELQRRYFLTRSQTVPYLKNAADYARYLLPHFYGARDEMVYLLMLDAACKVINCSLIGHGSVNSANVPIRRLVQEAINANASGIVLAHNHPSGIAVPSKEDVEITIRLSESLEIMELTLLDHIIVADDDFVSLKESGYFYR